MEQFIILLIIWLLVSIANAISRRMQDKKQPAGGKPGSPRKEAREPEELEIPPFLKEIFGMEEKPKQTISPPPVETKKTEPYKVEERERPVHPFPRRIPIVEEKEQLKEETAEAGYYPTQAITVAEPYRKRGEKRVRLPKAFFAPEGLRQAILLKEILDEPRSRKMIPGLKPPKIL
ncbi:MAG: hypothetical protein D6748_08690 [Calditrichaeota bacterium]|nr:MAG: hypothetical protein D6748_08690 [Calditrichota bacterium]